VDFAGDKMSIVDADTGEITEMEIFVGVLGCSGLLYVEATRSQDLKSWLLAHTRMYEAYAGVPRITTPDNLKSGVTKACWFEPELSLATKMGPGGGQKLGTIQARGAVTAGEDDTGGPLSSGRSRRGGNVGRPKGCPRSVGRPEA
jgi:hypothetical protein